MRKVGVAVKRLCGRAHDARRLRNSEGLFWLEYLSQICGSCLRRGWLL